MFQSHDDKYESTRRHEVYNLIEKHYRENRTKSVRRFYYTAGNTANSEDIVQEAYTRALQYWKSYKSDYQSFDSWINTIMKNVLIKFKTRDAQREENDASFIAPPSLRNSAVNRETLAEIAEMIDAKPPNVANILGLYMFEQYEPKEIEEIVPERGSNIRVIIHRFKKELEDVYDWSSTIDYDERVDGR